MKSYVWGTTHDGNTDIVTTDLAEASAVTGSISAAFGRRSWRQNLEFYTESGSVTIVAPSDARMMVEAISSSGRVTSEFGGTTRREGAGQRNIARLGQPGRGMLSLRTANGSVTLTRGRPAVGDVSDMDALKSIVAS